MLAPVGLDPEKIAQQYEGVEDRMATGRPIVAPTGSESRAVNVSVGSSISSG